RPGRPGTGERRRRGPVRLSLAHPGRARGLTPPDGDAAGWRTSRSGRVGDEAVALLGGGEAHHPPDGLLAGSPHALDAVVTVLELQLAVLVGDHHGRRLPPLRHPLLQFG